ncbi:hypothetical protein D6T64_10475 [Cryobacterium melibiosiphilum]|uniref:Uncharacterized protein n=1 Tax=Cryobacterium melibiosiphilum TaxID=995039 RepID=A0A3A5MNP7_9MICO|nr:hypothetical protein D6T64_10475 [Cryobacterium melibiosiphilum]
MNASPIAPPIEARPRRPLLWFWLTLGGSVLVLLGLASIGLLLALTLQASAAFDKVMAGTYTDVRNLGLSEYERSVGSAIIGIPMVLFLVAFCLLMLGELLRRAGGVVASIPTLWVLSPRVHLAWIAAPVMVWVALIALPVGLGVVTGWPAALEPEVEKDVWMILGFYGAMALGVAAVIAVSLVKKLVGLHRPVVPTPAGTRLPFWRKVTYCGRFDLWPAFFGGAFLGPAWIALCYDDLLFLLVPLGTGLIVLAVAVLAACTFWRSAEILAAAETAVTESGS